MTHFRAINGILLQEAVIVKPKHIVLLKKKMLTKNLAIFIKFWGFHSFFDKACDVKIKNNYVLDGNAWRFILTHCCQIVSSMIAKLHDKNYKILVGK
jgi:hypothetical protein